MVQRNYTNKLQTLISKKKPLEKINENKIIEVNEILKISKTTYSQQTV